MEKIGFSDRLNSDGKKIIFGPAELKLVEVSEVLKCLSFLRKPTRALDYEEGFFKNAWGEDFQDAISAIDEALGFECSSGRQTKKTSPVELDSVFRRIRQLSEKFATILTSRFKKGLSLRQLAGVLSEYTNSDVDLLVRCAYCLKETNSGLAAHFLRRAIQLKTLKTILTITEQRNWDAFHDWMTWFQDTFEESNAVLKIRELLLKIIDKRSGLTGTASFETHRQFESWVAEALKGFVESASGDSCFQTSELSQTLSGRETKVESASQALNDSMLATLKERLASTEFAIGLANLSSKVFSVIQDPSLKLGFAKAVSRQIAKAVWEAVQDRLNKYSSYQIGESKDSVVVVNNFSELVGILRLSFDEARALFEEPLNHLVDILSGEVRGS